jgi:3'-5' exoribonuclease
MEKSIIISEIKEAETVEGIFLVRSKNLGVGKTGKPFLTIGLMNKSGEIDGKVWENANEMLKEFDREDFIKVRARANNYQGKIQLVIADLKKCDPGEVDMKEFLPATQKDVEAMFAELLKIISGMKNRHLKALLDKFFKDEAFSREFKRAPAAKTMHHGYIGGLLEHTLTVAKLLLDVPKHYENVDRDLLVTGGILHDIGKVRELSYTRSFDYTDEGRLIGHIVLGTEMVADAADTIPGFPEETAMLLSHMLLSHHGEYEFGSPKRPKTVEAVILHFIEDMDSKVSSIQAMIKQEEASPSKWTSFHRLYDRYIYKYKPEPEKPQVLQKDLFEKKG